ncbi:MAG: ABC transporter permease [Piscirickettsiaceae bacterium]|nr:ABC transporter permease [Piscirickettsiaceae bacterium]
MNHIRFNLKVYLLRHLQVMLFSLGQLWRQLLTSTMTVLVISISLALPAGLYILLQNIKQVSNQWNYVSQISLFMEYNFSDRQANTFTNKLQSWPEIDAVKYQTSNKSLENFRKLSGLDDLLNNLPNNPLPATIIINIKKDSLNPDTINNLLIRLEGFAEVEQAQFDMEWLKRLRSINKTGQLGIGILTTLLSLSVLLVIGNTIRLSIINRQSEIKVIKLVGGTNNFINRPFLYAGFWFGALGGIVAWFILLLTMALLSAPINELTLLYNSQFNFQWFLSPMIIALPISGIILGIFSSWIATKSYLSNIEPH